MSYTLPELLFAAAVPTALALPSIAEQFRRGPTDVAFGRMRQTQLGLVDYLPYEEMIEPDVMLLSYGGVGALYEVEFEDLSVIGEDDAFRHEAWKSDALRRLGRGWMGQTYAKKSAAPSLQMPAFIANDAQRVLEESHIAEGAGDRRSVRHFLALAYMPPPKANTRAQKLIFEGEPPVEYTYEKVLSTFARGLASVEGSLRPVSRMRRLGTHPSDAARSDFLEVLLYLLYDDVQPVRQPDPFEPFEVGGMLAAHDVSPVGTTPRIGKKHLRALSVYGVPTTTKPGMMEDFLKAPGVGQYLSVRAIFQSPEETRKRLEKDRRTWAGLRTSLVSKAMSSSGGRENRVAAINEEKTENAIVAAQTGVVSYVHWSSKIVFQDADLDALNEALTKAEEALRGIGFTVKAETANTFDAYLGSRPFDGFHDVREGQAHSQNAARMWPSSTRWAGRETWNCKNCGPETRPALRGVTNAGSDFYFDPHDEDSQSFLGIGSPGSGKTTDLNYFGAKYRRTPLDQVFGIDKNRGQLVTCKFLGGDYRENERYSLFDGIENIDKRRFLAKYLVNLGIVNKIVIAPEQRTIVASTLEMMLQFPARHRSLSTFLNSLSAMDREGKLSEALAQYAEGGAYHGILDGVGSAQGTNSYEVHELGHLLGGQADREDKVAAPVLVWILNSFEDRLPGHRTIIPIDEAWAAVRTESVAALLDEELRTLRYRHAGIGFFTHSFAELSKSSIGDIIMTACKTRLIYPDPDAGSGASREFFEKLELNDAMIDAIRKGAKKRDIFLSGSGRFAGFQLPRSAAELAVYGCTGKDEVSAAVALMENHPEDWRERHLEAYGCRKEAARLRSLRRSHALNSEAILEAVSV